MGEGIATAWSDGGARKDSLERRQASMTEEASSHRAHEWGHRDSPWSPGRQLLLPAQAATSAALSRRSPTRDDAVIADLARLLHAGVDDAAQPEPSRTAAVPARSSHTSKSQEQKDKALSRAARDGKVQEVERLIAEGVSLDAKDGGGNPALANAAAFGHLDVLKLLRRHGANLEASNPDGVTALMFATLNGKADCAEVLLEWGANKDAAGNLGHTALHIAAEKGQLECARLLVRAGADQAARSSGATALDVAQATGHAEVAGMLATPG